MSKQQKTTERYLAKRQMLMTRKDECNRNIRDLGVLPEEAFEKYVNEKLERVQLAILYAASPLLTLILRFAQIACQKATRCQRGLEEVRPCEQKGI